MTTSDDAASANRSYLVHTGRELELMLEGRKPLAYFCDVHPEDPCEEIIPVDAFAPHVASGRFVTRSYVELLAEPPPAGHEHIRGTLHVFYALAGEEWRIDAYMLMQTVAAKAGWSEGLERLEGALLGYDERQCDEHMAALRANPTTRDWYWLQAKS